MRLVLWIFLLGVGAGCTSTPFDRLHAHQRVRHVAPVTTFAVPMAYGEPAYGAVRFSRDDTGLWVDVFLSLTDTSVVESLAVVLQTRAGAIIAPEWSGGTGFDSTTEYARGTESFLFGQGLSERDVAHVLVWIAGERHVVDAR